MMASDKEVAPQVLEHPGARPTDQGDTLDTRSLAHPAHPSTEECPCACYEGLGFIGHLIEEAGEDVEAIEAVPCRRCTTNSRYPRSNY